MKEILFLLIGLAIGLIIGKIKEYKAIDEVEAGNRHYIESLENELQDHYKSIISDHDKRA